MADWTTIPDSSIEPGKPIRSIDGLALRDNPIAIAEGAAGAPRNTDASLSTTATNTGRDWVLARNALSAVGAVGTYAMLGRPQGVGGSSVGPGGTSAGSSLRYTGASISANAQSYISGTSPSGTWRCMGNFQAVSSGGKEPFTIWPATLWLRIS